MYWRATKYVCYLGIDVLLNYIINHLLIFIII